MDVFDALHNNAMADNDLLIKNNDRGDVFTIARDVDFAFKTKDRRRAEDLCEFINGKNFGKARVDPSNDGIFWVLIVIHMPITQNVLCSVSGFMVCLGWVFSVDYDGWGSVIQTTSGT